jgi:hypothetical protein
VLTIFLKLVLGLTLKSPQVRLVVLPNVAGLELRYALQLLHVNGYHARFRRCRSGVRPAVVSADFRGRMATLLLEPMHSQGIGALPNCRGRWRNVP